MMLFRRKTSGCGTAFDAVATTSRLRADVDRLERLLMEHDRKLSATREIEVPLDTLAMKPQYIVSGIIGGGGGRAKTDTVPLKDFVREVMKRLNITYRQQGTTPAGFADVPPPPTPVTKRSKRK